MPSSTLNTIQNQFTIYGYSIFLILGIIGNIFIVILLSRHRQNACLIYLISSAIVNLVYGILNGLTQIISVNYSEITTQTNAFCKLYAYLLNTLGQIAKTMVILACIDRFMITSNRANFRAFSTSKRAKCFVFLSVIFWSLLTIHVSVMFSVMDGRCTTGGIYSLVYTVYTIIFVGALPIILLGLFGYLAYRNLKQMQIRVRPMVQNGPAPNVGIRRRDIKLLIMIVAEVILHIITTIPFPVILLETIISRYVLSNKSVLYSQIEGFLFTIIYLLLFINTAVPFYIYLISSKSFRREFIEFVRHCYPRL